MTRDTDDESAKHPSAGPRLTVAGNSNRVAGSGAHHNQFGDTTNNYSLTATVNVAGWVASTRPTVVGAVPKRAGYFQSRPQEAALTMALDGGRPAWRAVLSGMGGAGKTQLAAGYARQALSRGHDRDQSPARGGAGLEPAAASVLVWVNALTRQAIVDSYALAARVLIPGGLPDVPAEQAAVQFVGWLQTSREPWLIVLDDAPDPDTVTDLWPPDTPYGRTLVTTRSRYAAWETDRSVLLPVDVFTADQATAYLRRALSRPIRRRGDSGDDDDDLASLAEDLGRLPLALAQGAAYLIDADLLCGEYRAMLTDPAATLADLFPVRGLPDHQSDSHILYRVWDLSIRRADQTSGGLASPLLQLGALISGPSGIPQNVLEACPLRHLTDERVRPLDVRRGLNALVRLHLMDRLFVDGLDHSRPDVAVVSYHPLVQRAVRESPAAVARLPQLTRSAADGLATVWPEADEAVDLGQRLRGAADALWRHGQRDALLADDIHPVLLRHGRSLGRCGSYSAAVNHFTVLEDETARRFGPQHDATILAGCLRADWVARAGYRGRAVADLRLLADRTARTLGADHEQVFGINQLLAHWLGEDGDPEAAVRLYRQVLAARLAVQGADHPGTLSARHGLAFMTGRAGDPAAAVSAYRDLLTERERHYGPQHPEVLETRRNVAYWLRQAGIWSQAAAEYRALAALEERAGGKDSPEVLGARYGLALCLGFVADPLDDRSATAAGPSAVQVPWRGSSGAPNPAAALAAFRELHADQLRILGPGHPETLETGNQLASWTAAVGDRDGAIARYREVLADMELHLGPGHRETLEVRCFLAGIMLQAQGFEAGYGAQRQIVVSRGGIRLATCAALPIAPRLWTCMRVALERAGFQWTHRPVPPEPPQPPPSKAAHSPTLWHVLVAFGASAPDSVHDGVARELKGRDAIPTTTPDGAFAVQTMVDATDRTSALATAVRLLEPVVRAQFEPAAVDEAHCIIEPCLADEENLRGD